jgi:RNA polymerase sigma-70 factor (ECF subfamily)
MGDKVSWPAESETMDGTLEPRHADAADEALVARWRAGDLHAFEAVFARYESMVYNLAYRMMGNLDDAQDVKQEAFLRAHRAIRDFRGDCQVSTWLCRIATNLCLSRRRRADSHVVSLEERVVETADVADIEEAVERRRIQAAVQQILGQLPKHHRTVLVLRDFEGLSYTEMAKVLECSVAAVNTRLHRAREAFRKLAAPLLAGDR